MRPTGLVQLAYPDITHCFSPSFILHAEATKEITNVRGLRFFSGAICQGNHTPVATLASLLEIQFVKIVRTQKGRTHTLKSHVFKVRD
jgi:hypothetical protein